MPTFLLELYLSRAGSPDQAVAAARRLEEASVTGCSEIRYVRTLLVAEDETCFHVFEAPSRDVLLEAARRGGLADARLTEAVESRGHERVDRH